MQSAFSVGQKLDRVRLQNDTKNYLPLTSGGLAHRDTGKFPGAPLVNTLFDAPYFEQSYEENDKTIAVKLYMERYQDSLE